MSLMISYNMACKQENNNFYKETDIIRLNSPWYTPDELEEIIKTESKPKFLDINIKERKKPKIYNHNYKNLLSIAGKHNIAWIGISNIESIDTYKEVKEILKNDTTKICAKIETLNGCNNIDAIIDAYDGIMVDIEDLAFEIGWEETVKWKQIIYDKCKEKKKDHFILSGVIFEYIKPKQIYVYTYGAWDLLHPGHINMLEKAKSFGDFLIVGVVGDEAIRKLKGDDRPIQSLEDRMRNVGALKCVDLVVKQNTYDPTPNLEIYKSISILVKGDDWDYIPGEEFIKERGGKLIKPSYSKGWSTSDLIKKIRDKK